MVEDEENSTISKEYSIFKPPIYTKMYQNQVKFEGEKNLFFERTNTNFSHRMLQWIQLV